MFDLISQTAYLVTTPAPPLEYLFPSSCGLVVQNLPLLREPLVVPNVLDLVKFALQPQITSSNARVQVYNNKRRSDSETMLHGFYTILSQTIRRNTRAVSGGGCLVLAALAAINERSVSNVNVH